MGEKEITAFLSYLAVDRSVAASTQKQALNALVFLYRKVLGRGMNEFEGVVWASKPRSLPNVLSYNEVRSVRLPITIYLTSRELEFS